MEASLVGGIFFDMYDDSTTGIFSCTPFARGNNDLRHSGIGGAESSAAIVPWVFYRAWPLAQVKGSGIWHLVFTGANSAHPNNLSFSPQFNHSERSINGSMGPRGGGGFTVDTSVTNRRRSGSGNTSAIGSVEVSPPQCPRRTLPSLSTYYVTI